MLFGKKGRRIIIFYSEERLFGEAVPMSKNSHRNIHNADIFPKRNVSTYFGIKGGFLDMHTMKYRIFGAVWKSVDGRKYILGYWFREKESEILCAINDAGFTDLMKAHKNEINEIYQSIRMEQDKENWSKRSRLHFLSFMKKPWKDLKKGWYVIKSSSHFPCILTCIQKKRYSVWIEHIQVCENKNDAIKFINLINTEHNIQLTAKDLESSIKVKR
jgi:hypothetical protein